MHKLQSEDAAKVQRKQLSQAQKRYKELDSLIRQIYEDKVKGELSAKRFEVLSSGYESEQDGLESQIAGLQENIAAYEIGSDSAESFIHLVRRYTEMPELTGTILNEYIEKITVHEAGRSNGRREQDVDIYFSFIGRFNIPGQPEPEPFKLVEHKRMLWRRAYYKGKEKMLAGPPEEREAKAARIREYNREWRRKKREEKEAAMAAAPPAAGKAKTA
jgi:hypothetical protein